MKSRYESRRIPFSKKAPWRRLAAPIEGRHLTVQIPSVLATRDAVYEREWEVA